jgi:hypothetical protein
VHAESTTSGREHFTAHASLAALADKLRQLQLFEPIARHVHIPQKTVKDTPADKLLDAFLAILSGARSLCEINTRLRPDLALHHAFGRRRCAEQSVVQDTLDAATPDSVRQMHYAFELTLQQHAHAYRHDFVRELLVVDIDLTGLVCGKGCDGASKGYFADVPKGKAHRVYGRQLARATAAQYNEILVDRLCAGNVVLSTVLRDVVLALESALVLTEDKRARTLLRIDGGGGALESVNFLLDRNYHVLVKDTSSERAARLSETVADWYTDPRHPHRELGWVEEAAEDYDRPVRRLALRWKDRRKQWRFGVLITTLLEHQARHIAGAAPDGLSRVRSEMDAVAHAYDLRAGAIEIENKQDKMGLGIRRRQKRRMAAAELLVCLNALAHNALVWARRWLARQAPEFGRLGLLRMVRDLLAIRGVVELSGDGRVTCVRLCGRTPRAKLLAEALEVLHKRDGIVVRVSAE